MSKLSSAVLKQALELSPVEKAQVIEGLLSSLDTPNPEFDELWAKEADARVESFQRGELSVSPAEEVLGKYSRS